VKPYYQDDLVTLYHGDCRDILPNLEPVDLVITDPPYGINYVSNHNIGRGTTPITNDGARLSVALQRKVIPLLRTKHVLWFTRWDVWPDIWSELGPWFPLRGLLVWDKGHNGMGDLTHWGPSYELIASAGYGRTTGGRDQSIIRFNAPSPAGRLHPTEKPQPLLRYLIGKLNAGTVLDPFAGCSSTLLAAADLGVKAIGVEIVEENCERAARRLQARHDNPFLPFGEAS
jgi:site-specific DNA-methyltransferase (adenine-specific)